MFLKSRLFQYGFCQLHPAAIDGSIIWKVTGHAVFAAERFRDDDSDLRLARGCTNFERLFEGIRPKRQFWNENDIRRLGQRRDKEAPGFRYWALPMISTSITRSWEEE